MNRLSVFVAVLASLAASACLQQDTASTIYLRTDGSLDWVVVERNVRSDATDPAARAQEERAYIDAVEQDRHGVAEAFRALGAADVRTTVVRRTRPFAVTVDASFDGLGQLVEGPLAACGVPHVTETTLEGGVTTWTLWADLSDEAGAEGSDECGKAYDGLLGALDVSIVLESGRFVHAAGFRLQGGDRAVLQDDKDAQEAIEQNGGQLMLSLSWVSASGGTGRR